MKEEVASIDDSCPDGSGAIWIKTGYYLEMPVPGGI